MVLVQHKQTHEVLSYLIMECRRKFLRGAELVEVRSVVIERLTHFGYKDLEDLDQLNPAWDCLCNRFMKERFDPQMLLFEDHDKAMKKSWGEFIYWEICPKLLEDDEVVRNILRASGGLPCKSKQNAGLFLYSYISEMTFPNSRPIEKLGNFSWADQVDL